MGWLFKYLFNSSLIKQALYHYCLAQIQQRIDTAEAAMQAAVDAAQNETKSSVGDKYETGRAMMQIEQEKNKIQLIKAIQQRKQLTVLSPDKVCTKVEAGSLVICNQGNYYISIGLGKIKLDDQLFFAISVISPVGQALIGKEPGDRITFQGKVIEIQAIH